jgi:ppGpp synthetase/RelA/SpoT-type nucleotidyltranferase
MKKELSTKQLKVIDDLVNHFKANRNLFEGVVKALEDQIRLTGSLNQFVHSVKWRVKDPSHLKDKLIRKAYKYIEKKEVFSITKENLFSKINDLAGFRIIHLHTKQTKDIDKELKKIFLEQQWNIVEGPIARTWDQEMETYFKSISFDIDRDPNPSMYTSVHYIVKTSLRTPITCEIQVRTLMEEVWGEVSHLINYPHKTKSLSCQEQIKVLARATSSCSRLVDSIFFTQEEHKEQELLGTSKKKQSKKLNKTAKISIKRKKTNKNK